MYCIVCVSPSNTSPLISKKRKEKKGGPMATLQMAPSPLAMVEVAVASSAARADATKYS
jgi:hypothetical protein